MHGFYWLRTNIVCKSLRVWKCEKKCFKGQRDWTFWNQNEAQWRVYWWEKRNFKETIEMPIDQGLFQKPIFSIRLKVNNADLPKNSETNNLPESPYLSSVNKVNIKYEVKDSESFFFCSTNGCTMVYNCTDTSVWSKWDVLC